MTIMSCQCSVGLTPAEVTHLFPFDNQNANCVTFQTGCIQSNQISVFVNLEQRSTEKAFTLVT